MCVRSHQPECHDASVPRETGAIARQVVVAWTASSSALFSVARMDPRCSRSAEFVGIASEQKRSTFKMPPSGGELHPMFNPMSKCPTPRLSERLRITTGPMEVTRRSGHLHGFPSRDGVLQDAGVSSHEDVLECGC
jgi:hypothetical protein